MLSSARILILGISCDIGSILNQLLNKKASVVVISNSAGDLDKLFEHKELNSYSEQQLTLINVSDAPTGEELLQIKGAIQGQDEREINAIVNFNALCESDIRFSDMSYNDIHNLFSNSIVHSCAIINAFRSDLLLECTNMISMTKDNIEKTSIICKCCRVVFENIELNHKNTKRNIIEIQSECDLNDENIAKSVCMQISSLLSSDNNGKTYFIGNQDHEE